MAGRIGYNGADKWKLKATELLNEGGGGGTDDYDDLENKPKINNVELSGNKTAADLGMYTKSEVDTNLAGKMDLNATSGSISNLNILGNYGIGNVENGGRVYITGWQHKYYNSNFPEIAIARYDAENDAYYRDISMNTAGFVINNLDFDYYGNHGQGSVQTLDVHIGSSDFSIKEGIGDTNIIEVANTGNINVNASHVVFDSDNWVSAYAVDGFSFACDDDFEIDAVGIKIASDGITNSRALYVDSNGYLVSSAVTDTELGYLSGVTSAIQTQLNGKAASSHTHNYAGSSSAGGAATSANKINTDAGSATQPVYFSNGKPVATTYSLGKSVPSNAVFTDNNTTYTIATGDSNGQIKVTPSSGSAYNVGVKGLGSAAYLTADTAATANTVAKRQGNGYLNAVYFNMTNNSRQNPASYTAYPAFVSSDGYLRMSTLANFQNFVTGSTAFTFTKSIGTINYQKCYSLLNGHINVINVRMTGLSGLVENKGAVQLGSIPSANAPSTIFYCPFAHTGSVGGEQYVYIGTDGKVYISMSNASGVSNVMFSIVYVK